MAFLKRYLNLSGGKTKKVAIIFIILIIVISYGLFFYLQNNIESNVRNSIFEQQKQRQIGTTQALSQHIGSDLDSIMARLQHLANLVYLQQGNLFSDKIKKSMEQMYAQMNNITAVDRLSILDENNIVRRSIFPKGQETFVGINFSYRDWVRDTKNTLMPIFSNGFEERDGKFRIAITHPIINSETGKYIGLVGALIPTAEFFAHYGNIYNISSNFLVAYDKNGNYIATPRTQLLGKNYFGNEVQQFFRHNQIQNNLYRQVFGGQPSYAVYDFGSGERLNTGYPVFVQGRPTYFVFAVTPTSVIYSKINDAILTERIEMFSLLAGTTAAIVVFIIFLIKWSSTLNAEVKRRTKELNESNKQLAVANEQLKVHDKMQKEFINVAAHELRTPIQPILSLSQILHSRKENGGQEQEEIVDVIIRNAKRLQHLSDDILDVTRIESQHLSLKKERLNLNDLIAGVVEDYRKQIEKTSSSDHNSSNLKVFYEESKKEKDKAIFVEADRHRLIQVISHLLSNAVKFTKEEGGGGTISIGVEKKGDQEEVVVSVKDTGSGIDQEILPRLFLKFTTKSYQGTGLGLFISKSIIEAHGGKIWAENNKDGKKGATFYFSLPLSK